MAGCPKPAPAVRNSVAAYSMMANEGAYIASFVHWYARLGVGCHVLLNNKPGSESQLPELPNSVVIVNATSNLGDRNWVKYQRHALSAGYTWVLMVDCDEYLFLASPSLPDYISSKQREHATNFDVFQFPWLMVENFSPTCGRLSITELAERMRLTAHNHVKSMSRVASIANVGNSHFPTLRSGVRHIHREGDVAVVANGREVNRSWFMRHSAAVEAKYMGSALVHIHTRSLASLASKALDGYVGFREAANGARVRKLAGQLDNASLTNTASLDLFAWALGSKSSLPFAHWGCRFNKTASDKDGRMPSWCRGAAFRDNLHSVLGRYNLHGLEQLPPLCDMERECAMVTSRLSRSDLDPAKFWAFAERVASGVSEIIDGGVASTETCPPSAADAHLLAPGSLRNVAVS